LSFQNLKLIEPLLKALNNEGYATPTPIQQQSIPIILSRRDLLGCAQTGTGKTAAFALPILQILHEEAGSHSGTTGTSTSHSNHSGDHHNHSGHPGPRHITRPGHPRTSPLPIKALILTPTRELAIQIDESFAAYGKYTGLRHLVIFGGVSQHAQVQTRQKGIDILVATPGRLLDLIDQRYITLQDIKLFVLDEADRMLDMGFVHDVKKIITRLPQQRQTLFFSATMPPEIQKLASTILSNPEKVEVTPVSSTAETIQQSIYFVEKQDKRSLLLHILKEQDIPTALVFTRTKHGADKVAQGLSRAGIRAEAIHGNKSQNARQRALLNFKSRQTRILVATDIAARGIDIDELTHVINFELPNVPETYVHRIGRTGRAGASGIAISFCDAEEKEYLHDIQKLITRAIPVAEDNPFAMQTTFFQQRQPAAAKRPSGNNNRNNNNNGRQRNAAPGEQRGSNPGQRNPAPGKPRSGRPPIQRAPSFQVQALQQVASKRAAQQQDADQESGIPELGIERIERIERNHGSQPVNQVRKAPQPAAGRPQPAAGRPQPAAGRPQPLPQRNEKQHGGDNVRREGAQRPSQPQSKPHQEENSSLPIPINQIAGDERL
jgi:ATP-dependent RNA helicase RhlE